MVIKKNAANDPMIAIRPTGTVARRLEWVKVKVYEKTHQIGHFRINLSMLSGLNKMTHMYCTILYPYV